MRTIAAEVFLAAAAVVAVISSIGVLVMRGAYSKLHFVTPISLLSPIGIGIAVLLQSGWSSSSAQTWLTIIFMATASPFLSHATIRAARIRATGDWRSREEPQ